MRRSAAISAETPDASLNSKFITLSELPQLSASDASCPNLTRVPIRVLNGDTFTITRQVMQDKPDITGKVAVLNLASDQRPGGGWNTSPWKTQEDALCYSSTLFATLKPTYYKNWLNVGAGSAAGIFSPGVTIFRDDQTHDFEDLLPPARKVVSVISVAAPRSRPLTHGPRHSQKFQHAEDLECLRQKIRLIYRMAARHGKTCLVLGAIGCGAYGCPPLTVAQEMKSIIEEKEFDGWFQEVVFAIFGREPGPGGKPDAGWENFTTFKEVFEGQGSDLDGRLCVEDT